MADMQPRERIFAALEHRKADCVPRFEIWIDALWEELGQVDAPHAHVNLGQDCIMLPSQIPPESNAWRDGIDEWGRVWRAGMYMTGVVDTEDDLRRYSPALEGTAHFFDGDAIDAIRRAYPNHCLIYGTHIGPFMAGYMAMGMERFFLRMMDDPDYVRRLLDLRTQWCIAQFQAAIRLGAEVIVLGDDAASKTGPMISPQMWRDFVLPHHRRIVEELAVPVIWHSDGAIGPLLPLAVEAGFVGVHGLEPAAGVDLDAVKQEFGRELALIGNIDVNVLCDDDLDAVHREVDRCLEQGAPGGGYLMATCNSIFTGMKPATVAEMYRYQAERIGV